MRRLFVTLATIGLLAGCTSSNTAQRYLDTAGMYEGTLPAADCPGIRTTLNLRADKTYHRTSDYLERGVILDETGQWSLTDQGTIELRPRGEKSYRLETTDKGVRLLSPEGEPLKGDKAKAYELKRI